MQLSWVTRPDEMEPWRRRALTDCCRDVSNAGGAVGFPFLPATTDDVARATGHSGWPATTGTTS